MTGQEVRRVSESRPDVLPRVPADPYDLAYVGYGGTGDGALSRLHPESGAPPVAF